MRLMLLTDQEPVNYSGAKPHKPTSNSSPRTRIWITGVIQDVPLRTYRMVNSSQSYRVPNASAGIFHHIVDMDNMWQSAFGCEYHAAQDGSWGLTFTIFATMAFRILPRRTRSENIFVRCLCSADRMTHFVGFLYFSPDVNLALPMGVNDESM